MFYFWFRKEGVIMRRFLKSMFLPLGLVLIISLFVGCAEESPTSSIQFSAELEGISRDKILFSGETFGGHYFIYITNADGTKLTKLLDIEVGKIGTERHQVCATLSPDKSCVAFFSLDNYLSVVNINNGEVTKLVEAPQIQEKGKLVTRYIAWSPDGRRIAYTSNRDLYVVNADGSDNRKLAEPNSGKWKGEILEDQPRRITWSPDGDYVIFDDFQMPYFWVGYDVLSECRSVYTVNISTAEISQLPGLIWEIWEQTSDLTKALVRTGSDDWSVINIDGGVQEGFELPEEATVCKWSPDGSIIACEMLTDSVWNEEESKFTHIYKLWTVNAVNGETITVVDEIEDLLGSLSWSPEGDILACGVGKNRQLGIVDVATGEKIEEGEIEGVRDILWSPDGKHIAYTNWKEIFIVRRSLSHGFCVYPELEPAENEETLSWISLKAWLR